MSKQIIEILKKELAILKKARNLASKNMENAPEGRISVMKKNNNVVFYLTDDKSDLKYLPKTEEQTIKQLLQKRYDHAVIKEAEKQIGLIDRFLKSYEEEPLAKAYTEMNEMCRKMISVYRLPDEVYARMWQKEVFKTNGYPFDGSEHITARGERVRSKSEVMIADALNNAGLPYRYECALKIMNGLKEIYPDFTILDVNSRSVLYWEHFGRMDNDSYREKAIRKIETYANEGITVGNGLIVTFEDYRNPLSSKVISATIKSLI